MTININNQDYDIRFGMGFLRELDKKARIVEKNIDLGGGLYIFISKLLMGQLTALADLLYAGTCHLTKRPTIYDIENYIENVEDPDKLLNDVLGELEQGKMTKKAYLDIMAQ